MSILEVDLSFVFVVAVILIWFMIAYQYILTCFGFWNYLRSLKERRRVDATPFEYPSCSILIPAHNEEKVIARTIEAMLHLTYPRDKLTIIVINDSSTDGTREIIEHYCSVDPRIVLFDV